MTPEQRIHELQTRQMYVGSSLVAKLRSVNGYFYYDIWAWKVDGDIHTKFVAKTGKYNAEDPDELFAITLKELGLQKIKLGKPILIDISQRSLT